MTLSHAFFRADATPASGAGHVMRCFALAQYMSRQGVACHLLTCAADGVAVQRWDDAGLGVVDLGGVEAAGADDAARTLVASEALAASGASGGCVLIADSYAFDRTYLETLRNGVCKLAVFDDLADRPLVADWVINQNPGAETHFDYRDVAGATVLAGVRYVVLREGILGRSSQGGAGLLITLGGADLENLGLQAVRGLKAKGAEFPIHLMCSAPPSGFDEAQQFARDHDGVTVSAPGEIETYMLRADAALCAGGVTALELAHLGVPSVITVLADNQRPGAQALGAAGAALVADGLDDAVAQAFEMMADAQRRERVSQRGRALIDGQGAARIFDSFAEGFRHA